MKKILILIIGFFFLLLAGIIIYQKFYLSPRSIQKRKIEIFEERIKEFENSKSGLIDLTDSIHLRWRIKDFKAENHNIEYCENKNQDARYICTIDNKDWYGSDFKMDLPKNELKLLVIYIKGKYVELDISQMFNPNLTGELNNYQFKLKYYVGFYLLYGFFSDGAGAYTAQWKIQNGKTDRIKLSNEDKDFKWQNIK